MKKFADLPGVYCVFALMYMYTKFINTQILLIQTGF